MRLELDAGNSRVKWRLWDGRGRFDGGPDLATALQVSPKWLPFVEDVWVSSVHKELNSWITAQFPQAQFANSQIEQSGLFNAYDAPALLGVDRWLAMLAAWTKQPNVDHLVIDAGTALTVDVVAASGQHLGGYICPGYQMMKQALLGGTQLVRPQAQWLSERMPGCNTQQCVDYGIQDMVVSWLECLCQRYPHAITSITGGDAVSILKLTSVNITHAPDLVLDGLQFNFQK